MSKKNQIYWYCQIFGWSFYIILNSVFFGLSDRSDFETYLYIFLMLPTGIAISHFYRLLVIRLNVFNYKIPTQLVWIIFSSFVKGILFFGVIMILSGLLGLSMGELNLISISEYVIHFAVLFSLWNVIYFGFEYFQNYKRSEINSLRYLAASRESELKSLKAQLNPHFIFNCMNSIRALIDEDPIKAKLAVTQLSNILRNTLLMDKSKEILLTTEINLVKDYLDLEKIRYDERIKFNLLIADDTLNCLIPPFIIQSQVENAIKHGISKFPGLGYITVECFIKNEELIIQVSNTGKLISQTPLTGIGFKNSAQRLELLYGKEATIKIEELNGLVIIKITIPLKTLNTKI